MNDRTHETPGRDGTEDIVQTLAEPLQQILKRSPAPSELRRPPVDKPHVGQDAVPFRPLGRQPLALLTILDDGQKERGEQIRIRSSRVALGRTSGDVQIPFDRDMSAEHAELRCRFRDGRYQWHLIDKDSRNGTFVRAYRASLFRDSELMLGSRRYLFRLPEHSEEAEESSHLHTRAYQAPPKTLIGRIMPRLIEQGLPREQAAVFSVLAPESCFGCSDDCDVVVADDPLLSPRHARFYQDKNGRWMVEDLGSYNGVWIRIRRLRLDNMAEFQLGQQRFRFQPNYT